MSSRSRAERVQIRIDLLLRTAKNIQSEFVNRRLADPEELKVDGERVRSLVEQYFDLVGSYKTFHGYEAKLVAPPKIAAFTAVFVMAQRPFVSSTGHAGTVYAALANETFAWRLITIFLRLDLTLIPKDLECEILYNLHYGLENPTTKEIDMYFVETWLISTMRLLEEKYRKRT